MPLVSAIILNYRSPHDTCRCADALCKQTIADQMEILAVDNHSDDESMGILRVNLKENPKVRIVETPENLGFGGGNNYAARLAKGKYLLIINPDNVLPPDGVERMLALFDKFPGAGIVGPGLTYPGGGFRPSARPFPSIRDILNKRLHPEKWNDDYQRTILKDKENARDVDWMVGACLLIDRALFTQIGGFDERFFLFFEDIDICRRCKQAGRRVIFDPSIHVMDRERRLSGADIKSLLTKKTARIHLASAIKYFWKWRGKVSEYRKL